MPILTLEAIADAFTISNQADVNRGTTSTLGLCDGSVTQNIYLKFDLSQIYPSYTILSAYLNLYLTVWGMNRSINCYRATQNWVETTLTWNNRPSYSDTNMGTITPTMMTDIWVQSTNLSLSELAIMQGANYGFVLAGLNGSLKITEFASRESGYKPRLVIDYIVKDGQFKTVGFIGL